MSYPDEAALDKIKKDIGDIVQREVKVANTLKWTTTQFVKALNVVGKSNLVRVEFFVTDACEFKTLHVYHSVATELKCSNYSLDFFHLDSCAKHASAISMNIFSKISAYLDELNSKTAEARSWGVPESEVAKNEVEL